MNKYQRKVFQFLEKNVDSVIVRSEWMKLGALIGGIVGLGVISLLTIIEGFSESVPIFFGLFILGGVMVGVIIGDFIGSSRVKDDVQIYSKALWKLIENHPELVGVYPKIKWNNLRNEYRKYYKQIERSESLMPI